MMKIILSILSVVAVMMMSGCADKSDVKLSKIAGFGAVSDVKTKLSKTQGLQNTNIIVSVENGKTVLSGVVHSKKQKFLASTVARSVRSSGTVVNRLAVQ
ncbi:MAG: BON domain-containing protein [Sulfurovum sp.]|nr:MAG: BON domain-containing protein [Sulfurovum sp.]